MSLFHGTAEPNLELIFKHGFVPPSDCNPDPLCKKSGHLAKISSCTTLCDTTCHLCKFKHVWHKCHMFGLGVYFADQSSKSDIYVSDMNRNKKTRKSRKLLYCTVELGKCERVKDLSTADELHDRVLPKAGHDSIYAEAHSLPIPKDIDGYALAVMNAEYVIFHPYQALPEYMIEYDLPPQ